MSETVATPVEAPAESTAAEQPSAPQQDTTAPLANKTADSAVPTFVQSAATPQPAPPTEPQHAPVPETVSSDWREMIPRDIRDHNVWNKVHSPEEAFRSLVNAQELIGKKEVPIGLVKPEYGAPKEEVAKYKVELAKMLGVPDSASRYEVPESAQKVNGVEKLMEMAHKAGLGNEQFTTMMDLIAVADKEHVDNLNKVRTENLNALRSEWGEAYDQNLQVADIGLEAVDQNGEMRELLNQMGLNVHPTIIKHYHELGAKFREGNLKTGEPSSKETYEEQIKKLKSSDAYWEQGLDGGATRRRVDELMKKAGRRE